MKLVYTHDRMPGYRRVRKGRGFAFFLPDGSSLSDRRERQRIISLAIPPAYRDVWVCTVPNGHLQATGIDARLRKQYRYHPAWHEDAADRKFSLLPGFAIALPKIRASLRRELVGPDLTRERVIAGIVALLDITGYRIGNSRYEKENKTFGISSLLTRHLKEEDGQLKLRFRGKSGHEHETGIASPKLAQLVAELQDLPGQHLFRYEDEAGEYHDIGTAEVNDWLKQTGGGDHTAKQFRTWRATLLCARALAAQPPPDIKSVQQRAIRDAIKAVATVLNHTPATCRKYYIHPAILAAYGSGELFRIMHAPPPRLSRKHGTAGLRTDERRVYQLIEGWGS